MTQAGAEPWVAVSFSLNEAASSPEGSLPVPEGHWRGWGWGWWVTVEEGVWVGAGTCSGRAAGSVQGLHGWLPNAGAWVSHSRTAQGACSKNTLQDLLPEISAQWSGGGALGEADMRTKKSKGKERAGQAKV